MGVSWIRHLWGEGIRTDGFLFGYSASPQPVMDINSYNQAVEAIIKAITDYWRTVGESPSLVLVGPEIFKYLVEQSAAIEQAFNIHPYSDNERSYFFSGVVVKRKDDAGITVYGPNPH